jgi:hypothetical protein
MFGQGVDRSFLTGYFGFPGFRSCLLIFAVEYLVPLRVSANLAKVLVRQSGIVRVFDAFAASLERRIIDAVKVKPVGIYLFRRLCKQSPAQGSPCGIRL